MADRLPSLRGIEAFACVAEVQNLRIASERLHITVSAVSHRIQGLEAELGVRLFDRGPKGLSLTPEGKNFRARLLPGLEALKQATRSAAAVARKRSLRISAPPILFETWILPMLPQFLADWPDLRIEMLSMGRRRSAGADIVIADQTPAFVREASRFLFNFAATPMCSPEFLRTHAIACPEDLLDLPLIDVAPTMPGWPTWFAAAGLEGEVPDAAIVLENQTLIARAVSSGLGVALGSRVLYADLIEAGDIICPLDLDAIIPPGVGMLLRNDERETKAFADWLEAAAEADFADFR